MSRSLYLRTRAITDYLCGPNATSSPSKTSRNATSSVKPQVEIISPREHFACTPPLWCVPACLGLQLRTLGSLHPLDQEQPGGRGHQSSDTVRGPAEIQREESNSILPWRTPSPTGPMTLIIMNAYFVALIACTFQTPCDIYTFIGKAQRH